MQTCKLCDFSPAAMFVCKLHYQHGGSPASAPRSPACFKQSSRFTIKMRGITKNPEPRLWIPLYVPLCVFHVLLFDCRTLWRPNTGAARQRGRGTFHLMAMFFSAQNISKCSLTAMQIGCSQDRASRLDSEKAITQKVLNTQLLRGPQGWESSQSPRKRHYVLNLNWIFSSGAEFMGSPYA